MQAVIEAAVDECGDGRRGKGAAAVLSSGVATGTSGGTTVAGFEGVHLVEVYAKWADLPKDEQHLLLRLSDSAYVATLTQGKATWPECVFREGWDTVRMLQHMVTWAKHVRVLLRLLACQHKLWS